MCRDAARSRRIVRRSNAGHAALVTRVRDAIVDAPDMAHPITSIAEELGVSPFHLARRFRAETGMSPHQFLLARRIDLAVERLRAGEPHLSRLAADLGFSSHSHFTAVFRRHTGVSPATMRARLVVAPDEERRSARRA